MLNVTLSKLNWLIKPNIGLLIFYVLAFLAIYVVANDSFKIQFMLLNLILLHYLIYEFFNLSKNVTRLIFLQPYVLVIGLFFLLSNLLPNLRFFL